MEVSFATDPDGITATILPGIVSAFEFQVELAKRNGEYDYIYERYR